MLFDLGIVDTPDNFGKMGDPPSDPELLDYLATSFAGFDMEAVGTIRERLLPYPPSSPSIALFKDGKLVHMIERHQIEGRPAQLIAHNLIAAFEEYC